MTSSLDSVLPASPKSYRLSYRQAVDIGAPYKISLMVRLRLKGLCGPCIIYASSLVVKVEINMVKEGVRELWVVEILVF